MSPLNLTWHFCDNDQQLEKKKKKKKHFICHVTEMGLKIELAEFQHKSANKFSQKEFHSVKMKTVFQVSQTD